MYVSTLFPKMKPWCWVLTVVFLLSHSGIPDLAMAQSSKVQVQVGTIVDLVFDSTVSPETAGIGQQVTLKVASDVKVDGQTVIAAGATALGEVTMAEKAGSVGKAAEIGVTVKQVQAVDGTPIPLSGTMVVAGKSKQTSSIVIAILCCVLGLLQKGGKAEIPAGSTLRATVAAPVEVQPK